MNINQLLHDLGITETEAKIYLELLKKDNLTAGEISKITSLKRPTVYYSLEILHKKGLVFLSGSKSGTDKYKAEPPERFNAILEREKNRLLSLQKKLEKALPFFPPKEEGNSVYPQITYYQGMEGLKNLSENVFECKSKELFSIMSSFRCLEPYMDESYMFYYLEEKAKRGIHTKSIWADMPKNIDFSNHKQFLREVRIAPKYLQENSNCMIDIFDNNVVVTSMLPEVFGVKISSFNYSEAMKAVWKTIWSVSKKSR